MLNVYVFKYSTVTTRLSQLYFNVKLGTQQSLDPNLVFGILIWILGSEFVPMCRFDNGGVRSVQGRGNPLLLPLPCSEPGPGGGPRQEESHRFRHGLRTQDIPGSGQL